MAAPTGMLGEARLFIGQVAYNATEEHLLCLFRAYGRVTKVFILRNAEGFSKGAAFVSYDNTGDADCAIASLHDRYRMLPEKALQVSYAKSSPNISEWGRRQALTVAQKDGHNPMPDARPDQHIPLPLTYPLSSYVPPLQYVAPLVAASDMAGPPSPDKRGLVVPPVPSFPFPGGIQRPPQQSVPPAAPSVPVPSVSFMRHTAPRQAPYADRLLYTGPPRDRYPGRPQESSGPINIRMQK